MGHKSGMLQGIPSAGSEYSIETPVVAIWLSQSAQDEVYLLSMIVIHVLCSCDRPIECSWGYSSSSSLMAAISLLPVFLSLPGG
jgi:hypothetical protein